MERNRELEAAIQRDPESIHARLVYSDWLQAQGHPLGELIALHIKREQTQTAPPISEVIALAYSGFGAESVPDRFSEARESVVQMDRRAAAILDERAADLLGPLATPGAARQELQWRRGFIDSAEFAWRSSREDRKPSPVPSLVESLLELPAGLVVRQLSFGLHGEKNGEGDYRELIDAVARRPRPMLRELHVGYREYGHQYPPSHIGDVGALWAAAAGLEYLELRGDEIYLGVEPTAPSLRRLVICSGDLPPSLLEAFTTTSWPRLESLSLGLARRRRRHDVQLDELHGLLEGAGLPSLRHLSLPYCGFTDELCAALADSPLLRRLETLDLSEGVMSDAGARALLARRDAFAHLRVFDLRHNYLTSDGPNLATLGPRVITTDQNRPLRGGR